MDNRAKVSYPLNAAMKPAQDRFEPGCRLAGTAPFQGL